MIHPKNLFNLFNLHLFDFHCFKHFNFQLAIIHSFNFNYLQEKHQPIVIIRFFQSFIHCFGSFIFVVIKFVIPIHQTVILLFFHFNLLLIIVIIAIDEFPICFLQDSKILLLFINCFQLFIINDHSLLQILHFIKFVR